MKSSKANSILLFILLIGLLLRGLNSTFGSPSLYISNDEAIAHLAALNMIAEKTPVSIANYTPLGAYVQIPFLTFCFFAMKLLGYVNNVADFELFVLTHEGFFLFIPRLISTLFGTLTILVIFKITKELFGDRKTALVAAFLSAVSFNLVHISHFGRPWSAALFFMILAVYLGVKKKTIPAYFAIAISYGFHQSGLLLLPLVLMLTIRKKYLESIMGIFICIAIIILLSSLTLRVGILESIKNNQSLFLYKGLVSYFLGANLGFFTAVLQNVTGNLFLYFIKNFLVTDSIIIVFSLLGIFKVFGKNSVIKLLIFYIFMYFLIATFFFHPIIRYLLPIFLIVIPFSAKGLADFLTKKLYVIVIIILALASFNSVWWNLVFLKKPSFIKAYEWINKNVDAGTAIAFNGTRYRTFLPNKEALSYVQQSNSGFYKHLQTVLFSNSTDNVRNIVYTSNFPGGNKLERLVSASSGYNISYVIDYYIYQSDRLYNMKPEMFQVIEEFNPTQNHLIVGLPEPLFDSSWSFPTNDNRDKISMYQLSDFGPYVDILRVKKN